MLFSYTQVDLNLTLSRVSFWQEIQKAFQYIGFYQRPLATLMYVSTLCFLFVLYLFLLSTIQKHMINLAQLWKLIFIVVLILVFSYPAAFSYDFFNYLFTAKTVLVYHQNPYVVTPLQFAGIDAWTNFMRWTHLTSAYTPFWIVMSLVPYVLGLGYFILVLFAMKCMIAGFYLLACWFLVRVLSYGEAREKVYGLALFALNPLILIESLVSGHNDIVLVAFAMIAVWSYYKRNEIAAWFYLSLSIASKFMTLFLIPVFWLKKDRVWMLGAMTLGLVAVFVKREFLPWYWVWIMPFVALNCMKKGLVRFAIIVSLGLVASYTPYIYFGEYSGVEQVWKMSIIWVSVLLAGLSLLFPVKKRDIAS